jgi:hypothetical protein
MDRRHRSRLPLHDLQVHQNFAGPLLRPGKLVPLQIHQAHVFRFHKPLGNQRRRAECNIFTYSNRNVPTVAIHVFPLPQATPNLANLQLQLVDRG